METKYTSCRILKTTNKKLKIMAAQRETSVIKLIEILIDAEVNNAKEKTTEEFLEAVAEEKYQDPNHRIRLEY